MTTTHEPKLDQPLAPSQTTTQKEDMSISEEFENLEPCWGYLINGCQAFATYRIVEFDCHCGFYTEGPDLLLCTPCTERFDQHPDGETTCAICLEHVGKRVPLKRK